MFCLAKPTPVRRTWLTCSALRGPLDLLRDSAAAGRLQAPFSLRKERPNNLGRMGRLKVKRLGRELGEGASLHLQNERAGKFSILFYFKEIIKFKENIIFSIIHISGEKNENKINFH
jgi:hypothetical protein